MSMDHETESMMSGEGGSHAPHTPEAGRSGMISPEVGHRPFVERMDSVAPGDSASHNGVPDMDEHSAITGAIEDLPFTFKFKAPGGRVHRLQVVASAGLEELISVVAAKLGGEVEGLGGMPTFEDGKLGHAGFALSYMDNDGDTVSITTDHDLLEAITLARQAHRDKVDLFVHDPEKPALPPTTDPQPAVAVPPTPPESHIRQRKHYEEDEEEEEMPTVSQRRRDRKPASVQQAQQQEQTIPGVPNELLLPAAGVLAAVVIVTFMVARASSSSR